MTASTFPELEGRVLTLFGAGDYDAALDVIAETVASFPDRTAYTSFWAACVLAASGDARAAVDALDDGLASNVTWWSAELLRDDPDLAALQGREDFEALVEESERRGQAARRDARAEWEVFEPAGPGADLSLVALHGRTGNVEDSSAHWRAAARVGVRTVVVQSSQMVAAGMHCWDDLDRASSDVAEAVAAATADKPPGSIVLAGFSQGGGVATRLALAGDPVPAGGFIGICPSFTRAGVTVAELVELLPAAVGRGVRGWFLAGAEDTRYGPDAVRLAGAVRQADMRFTSTVESGLGHGFPPGFESLLTGMLQSFFA